MARIRSALKWLGDNLLGEAAVRFIINWIGPPLVGAGLALSASLQDFPLTWVLFAGLGGVSFAVMIADRLVSYWEKVSPEHKLYFNQPALGIEPEGRAVTFAVDVVNSANFPITAKVVEIKSQLENIVPRHQGAKGFEEYDIFPRQKFTFSDNQMDIRGLGDKLRGNSKGLFEITIEYGKKGRSRKYTISLKTTVHLYDVGLGRDIPVPPMWVLENSKT